MAERVSVKQETVEYYKSLMRIERAEFEKELLEIVSIQEFLCLNTSLIFGRSFQNRCKNNLHLNF